MIPELLWRRAWLLAEAHNHEWTIAIGTVAGDDPRPLSTDMVEVILDQWREERPLRDRCGYGVGSPFARGEWIDSRWVTGADGLDHLHPGGWQHSAHHRTGTGRCQWTIDDAGVVTILISRPGEDVVLTVVVGIDGVVQWTAHEGAPRYGVRHVEAAAFELRALGVSSEVPPRIAADAAFFDESLTALAASLAAIDHWEYRAEMVGLGLGRRTW